MVRRCWRCQKPLRFPHDSLSFTCRRFQPPVPQVVFVVEISARCDERRDPSASLDCTFDGIDAPSELFDLTQQRCDGRLQDADDMVTIGWR